MEATQVISGTSIEEFNSDRINYTLVFKESVAGCMEGVEVENITSFNVSSTTATTTATTATSPYRALRSDRLLRLLQTTESLLINYVVEVAIAGLTYDTLSSEITTAVTDGVFDSLLHEYAGIILPP